MLTSPIRSISDFSSAAGDVRLQIVQARDGELHQVTEVEREGLRTIRNLVDLGTRYGAPPEGNLDVTSSTPEQIDLAVSLRRHLIPSEQNIQRWAQTAVAILTKLETVSAWDEMTDEEMAFVQGELEPFLKRLLELPPEEPQE